MTDRAPINLKIDPSLTDGDVVESRNAGGLYVTVYEYRWTIIILTLAVVLLAIAIYAYTTRDNQPSQPNKPAVVQRTLPPAHVQQQPQPNEQSLSAARKAIADARKTAEEATETEMETEAEETVDDEAKPEEISILDSARESTPDETEVQEKTPLVPPIRCVKPKCRAYAKNGDFCAKHSGAK